MKQAKSTRRSTGARTKDARMYRDLAAIVKQSQGLCDGLTERLAGEIAVCTDFKDNGGRVPGEHPTFNRKDVPRV
ncbi:MAG: hypothetical protein R3E01_21125 [Pirellulaceae bacterium]